jgi:hypothetical protein
MKNYLAETNKHMGGIQKVYSFPNGYGASVIKHKGSYGGNIGLWEVAVLKEGELCYDTKITNDVIGHLNDPEVDRILTQIKELEPTRTLIVEE